jgi:adenine-specific DNA glycosylase
MSNTSDTNVKRVIRRFASHEEQEAETMRYWRNRSVAEKMSAATALAEYAYGMRGIDVHAQGPKGPIVRIQRGGR